MGQRSGIAVIDKVILILRQLAESPLSLADLSDRTQLPKATTYRIAVALEIHGCLSRDAAGRWQLGPLLGQLAGAAPDLVRRAGPILERLCQATGESAQLFRRESDERVCVAVADRPSGLRDTVPLGARLPMTAGSAAHVLLAWSTDSNADVQVLDQASFSGATLADVRRLGYAHSSAEREPGVGSVSAPVRDSQSMVIAAVSVSGPLERMGRRPQATLIAALLEAAESLRG